MIDRQFAYAFDWFEIVPAEPIPYIRIQTPPFKGVVVQYGTVKLGDQQVDGQWPLTYEWNVVTCPEDFDIKSTETDEFYQLIGVIIQALVEERYLTLQEKMEKNE